MGTDSARTGTTSNPTVAIIIPWRDKGDTNRKANLSTVLAHLERLDVAPVHVVSDGRDGPFNRCAAYNNGRRDHQADVYVWHEADMLIPRGQLRAGIQHAATHPGLVVPFTHYHYLSPDATNKVNGGADPTTFTPEWSMPDGASIGAVGVTSEHTMQTIGQWDETFSGWGYDDNAMLAAFQMVAPTTWVDGPGRHLYHTPGWSPALISTPHATPRPPDEVAATEANRVRLTKYQQATTLDRVRELTNGAT